MNWLVVIPTWGEQHAGTFERSVFPAIKKAAERITGELRFVIHTDQAERLAAVTRGYFACLRDLPTGDGNRYHLLSACHREALAQAHDNECVAFINADMVPSVEVFAAAEARFATGKRVIMTMGTRTVANHELPPIGAASADLLRWAWAHPHSWTMDCTWGKGKARIPSVLYFERDGRVVMHGFHLHPFALMKDRGLTFTTTVDLDIADSYDREEIHVVTDSNELAFAEISPAERSLGQVANVIDVAGVAKWARSTMPLHRWLFSHPIAIVGDGGDIGDRGVCADILATIERSRRY